MVCFSAQCITSDDSGERRLTAGNELRGGPAMIQPEGNSMNYQLTVQLRGL